MVNRHIIMTNNDFFPEGYQIPTSDTNYMKFQDGDNVFRILSDAIVGYEYWNNENKPVRNKDYPQSTPDIRVNDDGQMEKIKHFWAFAVYNYTDKKVQILEITQRTVMTAINNLVMDEDWGNPKEYDIRVNKTGKDLETRYSVSPKPKKPVSPDVLAEYEEKTINLEALYTGDDPFGKVVAEE
jgi:hypothetical protein